MTIKLIKEYKQKSGRIIPVGKEMVVTPEFGRQMITDGYAVKVIKQSFLDTLKTINDARLESHENEEE